LRPQTQDFCSQWVHELPPPPHVFPARFPLLGPFPPESLLVWVLQKTGLFLRNCPRKLLDGSPSLGKPVLSPVFLYASFPTCRCFHTNTLTTRSAFSMSRHWYFESLTAGPAFPYPQSGWPFAFFASSPYLPFLPSCNPPPPPPPRRTHLQPLFRHCRFYSCKPHCFQVGKTNTFSPRPICVLNIPFPLGPLGS